MENLILSIFDLLTTSPGNLVYHLVLGFSVISALQGVGFQARRAPSLNRSILGLSFLILGQIGVFITIGLAWQGLTDLHFLIPPLDRAIILFSLILIIWLWAFPKPTHLGDGLTILAIFLTVLAFLFSLAVWSTQPADISYNGSMLDQYWTAAALGISALGILALIILRPEGWGIGLSILLVNLVGFGIQFFLPDQTADLSGAIRLAQLCTYPLLPSLAQRHSTEDKSVQINQSSVTPGFKERRKHSADPRTVFAWLRIAADEDPGKIVAHLTHAIAQTMFADLCYLVTCPSTQANLVLEGGYDLIREEELPPTRLERNNVTMLANAISRGRGLRLGGENGTSPDLAVLAQAIGLRECGNLLLIPLNVPNHNWGAILLLSPYSNRNWTLEDQSYFLSAVEMMVTLLLRVESKRFIPKSISMNESPSPSQASDILQQLDTLRKENQLLLTEISMMRQAEIDSPNQNAMPILQEAMRSAQTPRDEYQNAQGAFEIQSQAENLGDIQIVEQLENQLRQSLEEVAHLQNYLARADEQIADLRKEPTALPPISNEEREVILSITQELRQPLASLSGYTELVLSESAGILGALQRKFMERIRTSTERMRSILDDLVQITSQSNSEVVRNAQLIHVGEVIDSAIAQCRAQIQAKNITLHIDFPEELPEIDIDHDALEQVVVNLLLNAVATSPFESGVNLRCAIEGIDTPSTCFILQITDFGGGIDPHDLPQVFSKRFRAEAPLIQGIGDSGIGLSIAKTLVEAHHGRIWVESDPGKTTTFSILFPLNNASRQDSKTG